MLFKRKNKDEAAGDSGAEAEAEKSTSPSPEVIDRDGSAESGPTEPQDIVYPTGLRLALLLTSVFVSMFLVALVRISSPVACSSCPWWLTEIPRRTA